MAAVMAAVAGPRATATVTDLGVAAAAMALVAAAMAVGTLTVARVIEGGTRHDESMRVEASEEI